MSVSCAEEGEEVKQPKFSDGQRVRVIGADSTFLADSIWVRSVFDYYDGLRWWPEYLLESAE